MQDASWWKEEADVPPEWAPLDGGDEAAVEGATIRQVIRVLEGGATIGILGIELSKEDPTKRRSALVLVEAAVRLGAAIIKLARRANRDSGVIALVRRS